MRNENINKIGDALLAQLTGLSESAAHNQCTAPVKFDIFSTEAADTPA
jgi:hypothetical protein